MLDGYKTYVVSALSFIYGISITLGGDPKLGGIFVAVGALAAALRDAINKKK